MRAWLYDRLTTSSELQTFLGGSEEILARVVPRRSQGNIEVKRPFLVFGLGNSSSEELRDSTAQDLGDPDAERQFFQVWIHDESMSFVQIDDMVEAVKRRLIGASDTAARILTVRYLETSAEFSNETYNTIFRYIRFQAVRTM